MVYHRSKCKRNLKLPEGKTTAQQDVPGGPVTRKGSGIAMVG